MGVLGFSEKQTALEKVSEEKEGIDKKKASTLEEISKIVGELEKQFR